MDHKLSRRDLLKKTVAGVSSAAMFRAPSGLAAPWQESSAAPESTGAPDGSDPSEPSAILPLTNTTDVFIPPRGRSFFKFSFDFPEPSVSFENLQFSFRVYTFENTYAPDASLMAVETASDGLHIRCKGFAWAGDQQKSPGTLEARVVRNGSFVECQATAEMGQPIKSIAAILRGVPRGKIAVAGENFFDPKDDELLFGYPFGGGSLFVAGSMGSPVLVVQSGEKEYFFLSALLKEVRASRFYLQPGEKGYRVELTHEREGWSRNNRIESPVWRVGRADSVEGAYRPHFEHLEKAFSIPDWESRADVPAWFREVKLVVSLHGMHWTGYIFNDFSKCLKILEWVATQIPGRQVLVFLPAWDGRYYWNYPIYKPDPRLGGEQGFRTLIDKGHSMGFHFMPMFGMNAANKLLPEFKNFADATTDQIDGDAFNLNWVDWDNDRHNEGFGTYMNLGVPSWRNWLSARITDVLSNYHVDAYFLDIAGGWENNTRADMHEGTRLLVEGLRKKFPGALVCGEMPYDALMSFMPLFHVFSSGGYPPAMKKYVRAFQHLSLPAPRRGSSGVHESGFGHFNPETLNLGKEQIPTITVVDDTFEKHRDVMAEIIQQAKERGNQ
jgi:hypothetical protein